MPVVVPVTEPEVPPGQPAAVLIVEEFVLDGVWAELAPRLRLTEEGGSSGATVESIEFNLAEGTPWPVPAKWWGGWRMGAGESVLITPGKGPYGDPEWSFSVERDYRGTISAVITFTDDQGRRGTLSAVVALP